MLFSRFYTFVVLIQIYNFQFVLAKEPICSKFAYEEQLLEKMIRTEIKVETMANEIKTTQEIVMDTLGVIKKTVQEFTDKFDSLKINITERMSEETQLIGKKIRKLERPSVAFYAHHVADVNLDEANERIVFDTVITNEGSGYDTSTGIFTAPVGGVYQFTVHICTQASQFSYIGIVHADNIFAKKFQYGSGNPYCSSVGGVIRVNSGEKVWVQSTSSGSNRKLNDDVHNSRMNIFYGMLINS